MTSVVGEQPSGNPVPVSVLAEQYAMDTVLYCHTFFPKTVRQRSAPFQRDVLKTLDDSRNRQVALEIFRDGAKTTLLRLFTSKRIAYGSSRTIMYVSASQAHSLRSVRWLRKQIEFNKVWATFYGLSKGSKWTDEHLEIRHEVLGYTITIIAVGITGQTRGINIDDYRPDLIIVDDADDEETTGTPEQRDKTEKRFFGAILNSLTPATENPEAKIVVLQTSLHKDDLINQCHRDPSWTTHKYSILDENNESSWPARYPTETVLADKAAYLARGQVLLWLREKECSIGDEETAIFKREWLNYWEILPEKMLTVVTCDPAPPPSETQIKQGLRNKDSEVWSVQGLHKGRRYLLEQYGSKDHDPEWSVLMFFTLCLRWRPMKVVIETVAYQRTLKKLLETKMREKKLYFLIESYPPPGMAKDKRKKAYRIQQAFSGIGSNGELWIHPSQQDFITQFCAYPNVNFDDYLDAAALGMEALSDLIDLDDYGDLMGDEETNVVQGNFRRAP